MQKFLLLTHFKRKGNVDALQNAHAALYFLDAASVGILKAFDSRGQCLTISKLLAKLKKHCVAFPAFSCFQLLFCLPAVLQVCVSLRGRLGEERGGRTSCFIHAPCSVGPGQRQDPREPVQEALSLQPLIIFCPKRVREMVRGPALLGAIPQSPLWAEKQGCSRRAGPRPAFPPLSLVSGSFQMSRLSLSLSPTPRSCFRLLYLKSRSMCVTELVRKNVFCRILKERLLIL